MSKNEKSRTQSKCIYKSSAMGNSENKASEI